MNWQIFVVYLSAITFWTSFIYTPLVFLTVLVFMSSSKIIQVHLSFFI